MPALTNNFRYAILLVQIKCVRKVVGFQHQSFLNLYLINKIKPMNGVIKKLTDKGFGFISSESLEKDLFFHSNSLVGVSYNELREGDAVTFDSENSPKGPNAVNVQRA